MTEEHPHCPAAHINNIWEEGTKDEACQYLQKHWNHLCWVKDKLAGAEAMIFALNEQVEGLKKDTRPPVVNYENLKPEEVLAEMKTRRYNRRGETEVILMKGAALIEQLMAEVRRCTCEPVFKSDGINND